MMDDRVYLQLVERIITEQEGIIGPLALEQARKVPGLKVDWQKHEIGFEGNQKAIIEDLVERYRGLFGQTSVEVCREAVSSLIGQLPTQDVPDLLR